MKNNYCFALVDNNCSILKEKNCENCNFCRTDIDRFDIEKKVEKYKKYYLGLGSI